MAGAYSFSQLLRAWPSSHLCVHGDIHYSSVIKDHSRDRLLEASKHQRLVHEYGFINRCVGEEVRTVLNRLCAAGVKSAVQEAELIAYRDGLDPAGLPAEINCCQAQLWGLTEVEGAQI